MLSCICTGRTHRTMWAPILHLPPLCVLIYNCGIENEAAPDRPYASARLVPHLTYGLYRIRGFGGVRFFSIAIMIFATEGPDRGVRDNYLFRVVADVRR